MLNPPTSGVKSKNQSSLQSADAEAISINNDLGRKTKNLVINTNVNSAGLGSDESQSKITFTKNKTFLPEEGEEGGDQVVADKRANQLKVNPFVSVTSEVQLLDAKSHLLSKSDEPFTPQLCKTTEKHALSNSKLADKKNMEISNIEVGASVQARLIHQGTEENLAKHLY